jgi:formylglycine-generating enzyme required for sulfatase activity
MLRWLEEARAGSGDGLERLQTECRQWLLTIAAEELPNDAAVAEALVNEALLKVPGLLSTFEGVSETELRFWLRQVLFEPLQTLPGPAGSTDDASSHGDGVTRGHGSGSTPGQAPEEPSAPASSSPASRIGVRDPETGAEAWAALRTVPDRGGTAFEADTDMFLPGAPQIEGFSEITPLAVGGMGVVYRARDVRLDRWVALKCLPPEFAEDPDRLRRFRNEVRLSAGLTEQGIVQVYGVLEVGKSPVLVLPYIDGCDLNRILTERHKLRDGDKVPGVHAFALLSEREFLARMLPFFDKILDVLVNLHGAGVLHRDLKPSNILVDKNGVAWLTDFGLARYDTHYSAQRSRKAMGTFGYMAPEQWAGEHDVDARSDVFSMGVTIYQALTLAFPYGRGPITEATPPLEIPAKVRRVWPANLDLVIQKALQPERGLRYQSAAAFRDDWQRVRKGLLPRNAEVNASRRLLHLGRRALVPAAAAIVVAVAAGFLASQSMPGKTDRRVFVSTAPPGARLALVPLSPVDGTPQWHQAIQKKSTPVTVSGVRPGDYLVIVEVPGHGFHEVFRRVPAPGEKYEAVVAAPIAKPAVTAAKRPTPVQAIRGFPHKEFDVVDDVVHLPPISIPESSVSEGMVLFKGGEFTVGCVDCCQGAVPPHNRSLVPFYLDKSEVTRAAYRAVRGRLPGGVEDAPGSDNLAVGFVTYDEAVRCAEQMGKRLPDEFEYEYAATNVGKNRFPWGDDIGKIASWKFGPVGSTEYDRALAATAVSGLYSNVTEWTSSWHRPYPSVQWPPELIAKFSGDRIVRGGSYEVMKGTTAGPNANLAPFFDARMRVGMDCLSRLPGLGFRCARSQRPRFPEP